MLRGKGMARESRCCLGELGAHGQHWGAWLGPYEAGVVTGQGPATVSAPGIARRALPTGPGGSELPPAPRCRGGRLGISVAERLHHRAQPSPPAPSRELLRADTSGTGSPASIALGASPPCAHAAAPSPCRSPLPSPLPSPSHPADPHPTVRQQHPYPRSHHGAPPCCSPHAPSTALCPPQRGAPPADALSAFSFPPGRV